jgi:hypothetical protein
MIQALLLKYFFEIGDYFGVISPFDEYLPEIVDFGLDGVFGTLFRKSNLSLSNEKSQSQVFELDGFHS